VTTDQTIVFDDEDNRCFACSPHNDRGLQLRFSRTGPHTAECCYTAAAYLCGMKKILHGGIQATLLDETMGVAAQMAFVNEPKPTLATVELSLHYRRPVPVEKPIRIRSELLRREGWDVFLKGEILNEEGEVLTSAQGHWRKLKPNSV
jgi:acyl-coenzyme A thioesterase PaaI-like protein